MKKTSVDKFLYGSNMSESEKIKMWQDQHAFEIKNTFGMTPNELQSKMDIDARNKVMKSVKVQLKYISEDKESIIRNKEKLEKPDLPEEDKIKLTNENSNLKGRKVDVCREAEKYLDRHINEKYGSSDVNVHTGDNIKYFKMVQGWFMNPPQGMSTDLELIGDEYPPDLMIEHFEQY